MDTTVRKRIRVLILIFLLLLAAAACSGCGRKKADKQDEKILELPYNASQIRLVNLSARARTESVYTEQVWDINIGDRETYREAFQEELKQFFLELFVMDRIAAERGITLTQEEQNRLSDAAELYWKESVKGDKRLSGLPQKEAEQLFKDYALALKLKKSIAESREAEVSESEARVIRLELVRTDDRAVADTIRLKAEEGGDLYALAQTYAASRGVPLKAGRGDLPKEVEDEVFALEEGGLSSVHEKDGMFLIYRLASGYDEAETRKRRFLLSEKRVRTLVGKAFRDYYDSHEIRLNDAVFRKAFEQSEAPYTGADFFRAVEAGLSDESISV